jgi:transposase
MQSFRVAVGVDWADEKHAVFLIDQKHNTKELCDLDQTPEAITHWANSLRERFPQTQIAISVEQSRGALIYALMKFDFLTLVPVNPKQLAKFREALGSSEAKDDPEDAELLAELFVKHGERLRVWKPDTEETRLLTLLNEDRRHLVDERTALTNRLKSQLKQYFPQALQLCGTLFGPVACALLERWSSLSELQQADEEDICQLYHKYGRCSEKQREKRLRIIQDGVPLTTDHAIVMSRQLLVHAIIRQIKELNEAIREYDAQIETVFNTHTDYDIFHSFPGAGRVMGPRLLCAFGTDRERFSSASELQSLSGIAPVTRRSGKSMVVRQRWACNKFLRQTFHEYAVHSRKFSVWARAYYVMMKERTGSHHAAVRALAFKWIRILYRCWKDRTPYDESQYMNSLQERKSPILKYLSVSTTDA